MQVFFGPSGPTSRQVPLTRKRLWVMWVMVWSVPEKLIDRVRAEASAEEIAARHNHPRIHRCVVPLALPKWSPGPTTALLTLAHLLAEALLDNAS
mmetsp:Transcript_8339/g.30265  ORF Transcript_8339/g.30265 Transcript_8339/m.30265 type:complete len:95 (+) Transcript_8339:88-372(+)